MTGQALRLEDLYVFVTGLEDLGVFEEVELGAVIEDQVGDVPVTRFSMECTW